MPLSPALRGTLAAVAEAAIPAGSRLPAGGERTVARLELALPHLPAPLRLALAALGRGADLLALRAGRRRLEDVPVARRLELLEAWRTSRSYAARMAFRALLATLKGAHFSDRDVHARSGCRLPDVEIREPAPRWLTQIQDLAAPGADEEVEADVAIIGSGAGGAAAARELAARGVAVVVLEAGRLHRRGDWVGSVLVRTASVYASLGLQWTIGDGSMFLPTAEAVGGTTTINSGTCLRPFPWIFRSWRDDHRVPLGERELEPYFERVEGWLEVGLPDAKSLGVPAQVVARGADALGLKHGPLHRNAPGCDAQATCCFGCPTGAKRSADVALVPAALQAGAVLFSHARVASVVRRGRDTVVRATSPTGRAVTVRARAVVFAGGALRTPQLLRAAGVRHPWLGRNLSVHPAVGALGLYPFEVGMDAAIPQGYGLESLREEGLLFEGAGLPFEVVAMSLHHVGPRYVELLEQYRHLVAFGFNVRDTARGRVVAGPRGMPLPLYSMNRRDLGKATRGVRVLVELLLRGGATTVIPGLSFAEEISAAAGAGVLDGRTLRATDMDLSAYHPLGTARMGADPATSVVDLDLRLRDRPDWLVCDGSVLPCSMGANPQITIMALAVRAAGRLAERLAG